MANIDGIKREGKEKMMDKKPYWAVAVAVAFIVIAVVNGYRNVGFIVVVIIGFAAIGGLTMWLLTTFHKPAEPKVIVPLYLLSLVGPKIHIIHQHIVSNDGEVKLFADVHIYSACVHEGQSLKHQGASIKHQS